MAFPSLTCGLFCTTSPLFVSLQVEQLFCLGLRSRSECLKLLEMCDWNLEVASTQMLDNYGSAPRQRYYTWVATGGHFHCFIVTLSTALPGSRRAVAALLSSPLNHLPIHKQSIAAVKFHSVHECDRNDLECQEPSLGAFTLGTWAHIQAQLTPEVWFQTRPLWSWARFVHGNMEVCCCSSQRVEFPQCFLSFSKLAQFIQQ